MTALAVLSPGARTLVVDRGFRGGRGQGVPPSGAMDPVALTLLNGLLGNPPGAAALEVALTAPVLRAEGRVRLALTVPARIEGDRPRALPPWTTARLALGEVLRPDPPGPGGRALIAMAGGIDLPQILGSRSTCLRAGFGGLQGRALLAGDLLPVFPAPLEPERSLTPPPPMRGAIRVVLGPQAEFFAGPGLGTFLGAEWRVTAEADRMGMRLDGPEIGFAPGFGPDITSDGIAPGAVQVPGTGRPIVLLADAQTTGGYAKIATVIRADLSRLAALAPGDSLSFRAVTVEQAEAAARDQAKAIARAIAAAQVIPDGPDLATNLAANLAGAAVDAASPDHFPGHLERDF